MELYHEVEEEEKEEYEPLSRRKTLWKASGLLIGGAVMAVIFADPLVDSVTGFSRASRIPSFFLSFVLLPFASNASEGVSSVIFASRKGKRNMSMTYSQVSVSFLVHASLIHQHAKLSSKEGITRFV